MSQFKATRVNAKTGAIEEYNVPVDSFNTFADLPSSTVNGLAFVENGDGVNQSGYYKLDENGEWVILKT